MSWLEVGGEAGDRAGSGAGVSVVRRSTASLYKRRLIQSLAEAWRYKIKKMKDNTGYKIQKIERLIGETGTQAYKFSLKWLLPSNASYRPFIS
jgi:hypothetical protein